MTLIVLERKRKVKWIDSLSRIDTDIEIASANSIDERLVFVFRIDDDNIMTEHETTENLELNRKRFTAS